MAVDWWMLNDLATPTIRFYRWSRPAVSIGYRQQENPPDDLLESNLDDVDLVVRPTGGGYLYHEADLSYSVYLPADHPVASEGIRSSYETLCEPFLEGALELGLLEEPDWGNDEGDVPNCLEAPAGHEPTADGAKWLASAQVRKQRALLQHGSLFWHESWSEELSPSRPHFLEPEDDEVSLGKFRDAVTRRLTAKLFGDRTAHTFRPSDETWGEIRSLADSFRVDSPRELPTFHRYR